MSSAELDELEVSEVLVEVALEDVDLDSESGAFTGFLSGDFTPETLIRARLEALSYDSDQLASAMDQLYAMAPSRERNELMYELLTRWGKLDPYNALAFAGGIESMELQNRAMGEVLEGWASTDPVSALKWLDTNGVEFPARIYGDYLGDIMEGYAQTNPQLAFAYVEGLPSDTVGNRRIRDRALREVIDVMVEQNNISMAIELTTAMDDDSSRTNALSEIVDEWAEMDPLAAKDFVESMADDPAYAEMQRAVLREWADDDPVAASEWLGTMDPEDPNLPRLATSLVERWTRYDLNAAAEWLNEAPSSPEMDRAVGIFSMRAAQDDPQNALTWAQSVSDDRTRQRLENQIIPMFREQDPQAFEDYLADSDYSDDKKQQYRELEVRDGGRRWGGWWR